MRAPEVVLAEDGGFKPEHAVGIVLLLRQEGWIFVSKPVVTEEEDAAGDLLMRMDGYVNDQRITSRRVVTPVEIHKGPTNLLELWHEHIGKHYALAIGSFLELF